MKFIQNRFLRHASVGGREREEAEEVAFAPRTLPRVIVEDCSGWCQHRSRLLESPWFSIVALEAQHNPISSKTQTVDYIGLIVRVLDE